MSEGPYQRAFSFYHARMLAAERIAKDYSRRGLFSRARAESDVEWQYARMAYLIEKRYQREHRTKKRLKLEEE